MNPDSGAPYHINITGKIALGALSEREQACDHHRHYQAEVLALGCSASHTIIKQQNNKKTEGESGPRKEARSIRQTKRQEARVPLLRGFNQ